MRWSEVISQFPKKVVDETRAGLVHGFRVELSTPDAAARLLQLSSDAGLWIVDDLQGLAAKQPMVFGVTLLEVFGLGDDHRAGLSLDALREGERRAAEVMRALEPKLSPHARGALSTFFVWSGPLCGGRLVKGVFEEQVRPGTEWYESEAPLCTWEASRGANQDAAPGGVFGVELFGTVYDSADEPPVVTAALLSKGDAALADAGLLTAARVFALPHYD
jgi:hypothetical protein